MAYTCELDISTMNRIESGVYIPRITTLKTIAKALDISLSLIVDFWESKYLQFFCNDEIPHFVRNDGSHNITYLSHHKSLAES